MPIYFKNSFKYHGLEKGSERVDMAFSDIRAAGSGTMDNFSHFIHRREKAAQGGSEGEKPGGSGAGKPALACFFQAAYQEQGFSRSFAISEGRGAVSTRAFPVTGWENSSRWACSACRVIPGLPGPVFRP